MSKSHIQKVLGTSQPAPTTLIIEVLRARAENKLLSFEDNSFRACVLDAADRLEQLEAKAHAERAEAVMDFAESIRGAYVNGFTNNHPEVYSIYQAARNHVFDRYKQATTPWDDEDAKQSQADSFEKLEAETEALRLQLLQLKAKHNN